jgi:phage/plasmid-like protein (TIGR03299 family)
MNKMAHNIAQTKSGKWMTAWAGDTPWHRLGTQAQGLMTAEDALALAHLNWLVEKRPLYNRNDNGELEVIPDTYGVFRKDELGNYIPLTRGKAVGRVWTPFQNVESIDFLDELTQNQEAKIEVCGALGNGEQVWVLARLPESITINGLDVIDQYILIVNNHDGSGSLKVFLTPIRVVCNNTLTMALNARGRTNGYNIRHTGSIYDRVEAVREALGMINDDFHNWGELANTLVTVKMTEDEMDSYFIDVLGLSFNKEGDLTTRSSNILSSVKGLLANDTNTFNGMAGTAWAAYNAVTEAIDHHFTRLANGEVSKKRMESALFGTFSRTKQKAFIRALEMTV